MPTKLISRSVQFHPEIWILLQNEAERKDKSTSSFIRDCVEDYLKRNLIKNAFEMPVDADKDTIKRLSDKNLLEMAKYMNQIYEKDKKKSGEI